MLGIPGPRLYFCIPIIAAFQDRRLPRGCLVLWLR